MAATAIARASPSPPAGSNDPTRPFIRALLSSAALPAEAIAGIDDDGTLTRGDWQFVDTKSTSRKDSGSS